MPQRYESISYPMDLETQPRNHGASVIFYVRPSAENPYGSFVFFLRDNNAGIPYPNQICPIGGGVEEGEDPRAALHREVSEELYRLASSEPYAFDEHTPLSFLATVPYAATNFNGRTGIIDVFGCILSPPHGLYTVEGQGLVELSPQETLATDFPYNLNDVVKSYVTQVTQFGVHD